MSGVPMSSDVGHAFSGGTLSERERIDPAGRGADANRPNRPLGHSPRSESVSYTARACYGNTGEYATLEEPACREVARFPTLEAAQAYALELNTWLDARPDPAQIRPFFDTTVRVEPSYESLLAILARAERPERIGL